MHCRSEQLCMHDIYKAGRTDYVDMMLVDNYMDRPRRLLRLWKIEMIVRTDQGLAAAMCRRLAEGIGWCSTLP